MTLPFSSKAVLGTLRGETRNLTFLTAAFCFSHRSQQSLPGISLTVALLLLLFASIVMVEGALEATAEDQVRV